MADQNWNRIFPSSNPRGSGYDPVAFDETVTNDITIYNTNANKQKIFQRSKTASLSYLSIPASNKVMAGNGGSNPALSGTWVAALPANKLCLATTSNGANVTYSFTTTIPNQAVYYWYPIIDADAGTQTLSLDSGSNLTDPIGGTTTFSSQGDGGALIATQNQAGLVGSSVAGVRLVVASAGAHTLAVTATSANGTIVGTCGIGVTPATTSTMNPYVVAVSGAHRIGTSIALDYLVPTYNTFIQNIASQLVTDHANVPYADVYTALGTTSGNFASDGLHWSDAGHQIAANTVVATLPASLVTGNAVLTSTAPPEGIPQAEAASPDQYPSPNPLNPLPQGWGWGTAWYKGVGTTLFTAYLANTGLTTGYPLNGSSTNVCLYGYARADSSVGPPDHLPAPSDCLFAATGQNILKLGQGAVTVSQYGIVVGPGKAINHSDYIVQKLLVAGTENGFTTTAATSDVLSGYYVYSTSACYAQPQNATAAAMTGYYVIWTSSLTLTFYHPATAGGLFRIFCTGMGQ